MSSSDSSGTPGKPEIDAITRIRRQPTAALGQMLIAAALEESRRRGLSLAFAVVDLGGNLMAALRDDGAQLGALTLAIDKAFTAVNFGMPTSAWRESSLPGNGDWGFAGSLGGRIIVFPGGVPLYAEGELIGAFGVSGTASEVDEECALRAVAQLGIGAST